MIYYKVCRVAWERLTSTWFGDLDYGVGLRTYPIEKTGLLAFRTLCDARAFQRDCMAEVEDHDFLVLEGVGELGPPLPELWTNPLYPEDAVIAWTDPDAGCLGTGWPEGTVSLAWFEGRRLV